MLYFHTVVGFDKTYRVVAISNTNDLIILKYADPQSINASVMVIEQYLPALLVYFNGQEFNVRWVDDIISQSKGIFRGF